MLAKLVSFLKRLFVAFTIYFLPKTLFIRYKYLKSIGQKLNLSSPLRLTEKIQWLKLHNKKKLHVDVTDKIKVRDYVKEIIGETHLVPLIDIYEKSEDIKQEDLQRFSIIKCNHDSSGGTIIRNQIPQIEKIKKDYKARLKHNHYYQTKEWQYKHIKPKILIEKLLITSSGCIPNDYKFHCFHGVPKFVYCSIDRENLNYRKIYDTNWNELKVNWKPRKQEKREGPNIPKPKTIEKMLSISRQLSKDFEYCRVDLYEVDQKVFFGEITLHPHGGFESIDPIEYDYEWGSFLDLSQIKNEKKV